MYDAKMMQLAIREANQNAKTQDGGPFGSVIVDEKGNLIASGHNQVLGTHDPTAHGEIVTIRKACQQLQTHDLAGCTLYTNAYPCPMCLSAIIWANIKTVYYGNTAADAAAIGFRDDYIYQFINAGLTDQQVLKLEQHDRPATIKSFKAFQAKTDKQLY